MLDALQNAARPADLDVLNLCLCGQTKVNPAVARRHEAHAGADVVKQRAARAGRHLDGCANAVAIALVSAQFEYDPVIAIERVID